MNKITIHGNVTATPELRHARSGVAVTTFTVAANRRRLDRRSGTWTDQPPVFHRVVCFNALAENVAASLTRGTTVAVTGEFADDSYTRDDGGPRIRRIQIEASDVAVSLRYATTTITKNQREDRTTPTAPQDTLPDDASPAERDDNGAEPRTTLTVVGADD